MTPRASGPGRATDEERTTNGVYAYEVTKSNIDTVSVGTFVIDVDFEGSEARSWPLWDSAAGDFTTGWVGVRRARACLACYEREADPLRRTVRPHGHDGPHGPGEPLRPTRRTVEVTA